MVGLIPRLSFDGVADYVGLALGLTIGFAIFAPVAATVESNLRRGGN